MYEVVMNVIKSKNYELTDMLKKIDTLWLQGSITEEQRLILISEAQNNANVENSIDMLNKLYELDRRVKLLEERFATDKPTDDNTQNPTYPSYESGKWYVNGDIVEFEGQNYKCIAPEGQVCTWSPSEYPAYWEEVVEDKLESETE